MATDDCPHLSTQALHSCQATRSARLLRSCCARSSPRSRPVVVMIAHDFWAPRRENDGRWMWGSDVHVRPEKDSSLSIYDHLCHLNHHFVAWGLNILRFNQSTNVKNIQQQWATSLGSWLRWDPNGALGGSPRLGCFEPLPVGHSKLGPPLCFDSWKPPNSACATGTAYGCQCCQWLLYLDISWCPWFVSLWILMDFVSTCVNYDYEIVGVGDNHDDSNCDSAM